MAPVRPLHPTLERQQGAALITGLIFLIVLTMMGITAARMSTLEERMAGNLRDRALAMQAAELALRDAERDILNSGRISGISNFVPACTNGLCYNGSGGFAAPVWTCTVNVNTGVVNCPPVANEPNILTIAPSVAYRTYTGAAVIPLVSAQPRYLIEGIRKTPPGSGETFFYRVTVRAQGMNANTVVWLQEIFKP